MEATQKCKPLSKNTLTKKYRAINLLINTNIRQSTLKIESSIISSDNVKSFYKYANSKLSDKCNPITLKSTSGLLTCDPFTKATLFNDAFLDNFKNDNGVIPDTSNIFPPPTATLSSVTFPVASVALHLNDLKGSHTITPDGFSSYTIKLLRTALIVPLSYLFEVLFMHHYLPLDWKRSFITPVFKKGSRTDPSNYRPIAITSILCRIMERVVKDQITNYLICNDLIASEQHGFLRNKSTTTNLLETVLDWDWAIDGGNQVDVIYLDFSKAFDSVVYSKLFFKLESFGLTDILHKWLVFLS